MKSLLEYLSKRACSANLDALSDQSGLSGSRSAVILSCCPVSKLAEIIMSIGTGFYSSALHRLPIMGKKVIYLYLCRRTNIDIQ
ncbi:MAG: hypothetical protein M3Z93_06100 [Commensalibacter sp.]|nr:hypothetical protein [Commensalibacter sp.]